MVPPCLKDVHTGMTTLPTCVLDSRKRCVSCLGQRERPCHLRDKTTVLQPFTDIALSFVQHVLLASNFRHRGAAQAKPFRHTHGHGEHGGLPGMTTKSPNVTRD